MSLSKPLDKDSVLASEGHFIMFLNTNDGHTLTYDAVELYIQLNQEDKFQKAVSRNRQDVELTLQGGYYNLNDGFKGPSGSYLAQVYAILGPKMFQYEDHMIHAVEVPTEFIDFVCIVHDTHYNEQIRIDFNAYRLAKIQEIIGSDLSEEKQEQIAELFKPLAGEEMHIALFDWDSVLEDHDP